MLVMLCIANINATRFLEETTAKPEVVPKQEDTKKDEPQTISNENSTENGQDDKKDVEEVIVDNKVKDNEVKEQNSENQNEEKSADQSNEAVKEEENKGAAKEEENKEATKEEEPKVIPQEENKETKKETEEKQEDEKIISPAPENKDTSYFGLSFGFILLLAASILFFFVGFYRYSLRKYKIPPFSPPSFCPNFLFPRPENDLLMEDYCIQSGTEMGGVYSSEKYHNFY
ncbi:hypothetical protein ABPG73_015376 [Tetrahymena malaccensis]